MPLLGNVIFVVGAVGIGLIAWKVLPKLFDGTKKHFEFKEDTDLPILDESACGNCVCRDCDINLDCPGGCTDCDENEIKN